MIRRCKSHHIDILIFQQFPNIGVPLNLLTLAVALLNFSIKNLFIDIAQRHEPRSFDFRHSLEMVLAASMKAYNSVSDIAIGSLRGKGRQHI